MKKNKTKKALATLAIAGMAVTMIPFNAFADGVTTARLYGADRIGTAVQVADAGWTTADTAILAPSANANLVDALAAAPLAGKNSPILLTDNNTLSAQTQTELTKLGVKNVYVVGAISQTVVDQVKAMGLNTTVLKGADRIGTATQISAKLAAPAGSFVVGYGALADALSVASYAAANNYSILVANPDGSLPASEKAYLGSKVYMIGGPTLVADVPGATRLYGQDRFETNKAVLSALGYSYDDVYVANGTNAHLVDSLVASSLAAKSGAPIVLGDTTTAAAAANVHAKLAANAVVTALGGSTVVPDAVVAQVANGTTVTPPTSNVTISNLTVTGQAVGTGSTSSPAVVAINNPLTVKANISGASTSNATVTILVSTSTNITAKDANGNILSSTTLNTPIVIGNDTFKATYSVPADASGNVAVSFVSTASSNQAFNIVVQAPFYNNGQPVRSNEVRAQWGVPGTLVLSPIYTSGSPDNLNFSSSSKPTNGLVPIVATYLPVSGSTTTMNGQSVKFTMTTSSGDVDGGATAFFTDENGAAAVGQNSWVGTSTLIPSATFNATTDSNGQALVYINANQPTTNSVANLGASIQVGVQAQLVNGGGSTSTGYYKWQSVAQASQIANLSPSQMLNPTGINSALDTVIPDSAEKDTSGSQVTISGTVQDAAGNPVPNVTLAMQDYDPTTTGSYSNNIQNDAFVQNGTTTLFSATAYPVVTTDSNGNFSFTVTANVPVTQSVYNSQTKYYIYYVPNTVSLANGQSLPSSGMTKLTFLGDSNASNDFINLVWTQGQTVQTVGISANPLQSQYSSLSDVPSSNQSFSLVMGDNQKVYVAGFNQNGQMVAPTTASTSGNQFAGYGTDFNITLPSGMNLWEFGNGTDNTGALGTYMANNTVTQAELRYYAGALYLVALNNTPLTNISSIGKTLQITDPAAYDGSGQLMFKVMGDNSSNSTSGAINVTVSAYNGITDKWSTTNAQGAGSASITGSFTQASTITSLGVTSDIASMITYGPLLNQNAAPGNTQTVSGTAFDGFDSSKNTSFVASAFNNFVAISPVPTQGVTYSLSATKSGKFRSIDGFQLYSAPQSASVNIQNNGLVSVNNTAIWTVPTGTVVGYEYIPSKAKTYVLIQTGTDTFHLYRVDSGVSVDTGFSWTVNSATPAGFEGYLGFNIDGSGNLKVYDNSTKDTVQAWPSTGAQSGAATELGLTATQNIYFAPVQAITVGLSDKYAESPVVTIANSVNSQTATVTNNFTSVTGGLSAVKESPSSVNFVLGSSQDVTLTAVDMYGNALPNQTIYVQGSNVKGLWITQVNGTAIQSTINLAGTASSNTNFSTVATPVPMFVYNSETALTNLAPDYNNVNISGSITAYHLSDTTTPYVALVTGTDGTVKITVQNGNVQYYAAGAADSSGKTAPATNVVDPGTSGTGTLNFYSSTPTSSSVPIGSISVSVN